MGIFKQFLSTDVTVVPFIVNKSFTFTGFAEITGSGIDFLSGNNIPDYSNPSSSLLTGVINTGSYQKSVFNSIKQLYYTNYLNNNEFILNIFKNKQFVNDNDDIGIDSYYVNSNPISNFYSETIDGYLFCNIFDFSNTTFGPSTTQMWLIQATKKSYYSPFTYNTSTISKQTPPQFITNFSGEMNITLTISKISNIQSKPSKFGIIKNGELVYTSPSYIINNESFSISLDLNVNSGDILKFGIITDESNVVNNPRFSSPIRLILTRKPGSSNILVTNSNKNIIESDKDTNLISRFYNYEDFTNYNILSSNNTNWYNIQASSSRYFPNYEYSRMRVWSIPKELYGDYINPRSTNYRFWTGVSYFSGTDDGDGYLTSLSGIRIGVINYQHGLLMIPISSSNNIISQSAALWTNMSDIHQPTMSFQSTRTIYETQYKCTIRPDEFNFSLNPSLISGSTDGTPYNFVTSSYFSPYVTTVGLYDNNQELLAVAKLAKPLPTSATTDTTILVNIDR